MNEFMSYDDRLEIMNEFASVVNGKLYDGMASDSNYYDQDQDDSEEYRWYNA